MARHATVGSGHGWLGAVVARQAAGCNGRYASTAGFLVRLKPTCMQDWITLSLRLQLRHLTVIQERAG